VHPKREDQEKKNGKRSEGRPAGVMESSQTSSIIRQENDIVAHKKRDSKAKKKQTSPSTKYTNDEMKYVCNFKDIFASFYYYLVCRVTK
jgi:hypothetical protein